MRRRPEIAAIALFLVSALLLAGCGYTTKSLLPPGFKSICIDNFKNKIVVNAEQSNLRMYRGYRPGMEVDLTKTIINKFLLDFGRYLTLSIGVNRFLFFI